MNRNPIAVVMGLAIALTARGAWPETAPPAPPAAPAPPAYGEAASDMPLAVYRKFKVLWDATHGLFDCKSGKADPALPADVKSKDGAQKALAQAATAQKAELIKALRASQVIHRELSAKTLRHCEDAKAAIEGLGQALGADPDETVRVACAASLGALKDAAGVEALLRALQDKEESVRSQAVSGLSAIRDNRATAPLLEVLARDEKPSVRRNAASALAEIKDQNALEGLVKALDAEQDYRVKMAIAGAIRAIRGKDTEATQNVPDARAHDNVLTRLAKDMRGVEDKLRGDRHDQAVQTDQKEIESKLTKLIEQVEQMQQSSSSSSSSSQQQQQQSSQQKQGSQQAGAKRPSSPMPDSRVGGGAERGALSPAEVASRQAEWAKLPAAMRDEILQVDRPGMPDRWRARLVAYYLSLAAEESAPNR